MRSSQTPEFYDKTPINGAYKPETISIPELVPMRLAPARIIAMVCSAFFIPPLALTPMVSPTANRMASICSTVAPAVEKPVLVFTKAAPAIRAIKHALKISCISSKQVSRITLTGTRALSTTARISSYTA